MERPPMNQEQFDKQFAYERPHYEKTPCTRVASVTKKFWRPFTSPRNFANTVVSFIPILHWLPRYDFKKNLLSDAIGGVTVGIMHVPQGIAYAILAGVDPVVGLYTSLFPALLYMIFGTSRHCSTGTFAVVALMTGKAVHRLAAHSLTQRHLTDSVTSSPIVPEGRPTPIQVTCALTLLIGAIQVLVAALGLDFVTTYFSDQLVAGFTTGASLHVFITQIKDILGLKRLPRRYGMANCILKVYDICANIARTNLVTLGLSAMVIVMILLGKNFLNPLVKKRCHCPVPVPMELIAVIIGTLISQFADLKTNFGVQTVGLIPAGLPPPTLPRFDLFPSLIMDAISISVVVMAIHVSLAKILAKKFQYEIVVNQEFYAMGFTSMLSGFFPVFPHSSSLSRSMVSAVAGSKTQLCSIFSCLFILVLVEFSGSWLQPLPMCVLASIIVAALLSMFKKFQQLVRLWRLSKIDFSIWVVAFVATVATDVMQGLFIAIVFALFTTVIREQWPRWHILANIAGTYDFRDVERYRHIYFFNSVCVLRFDSPLLFTNVARFRKIVDNVASDWDNLKFCGKLDKRELINGEASEKDTTSVSSDHQKKYLIIDCSGFAYVDVMGVNSLKEIHEDLCKKNICVSFAAAKAPVRELFEASGLYAAVAKSNFYPTIYDAIAYAQMERSGLACIEENISAETYVNDALETRDETAQCSRTPTQRWSI